jgi:hypothetical protein
MIFSLIMLRDGEWSDARNPAIIRKGRLWSIAQPAWEFFQGLQVAGWVEVLGLRHSGPRPFALGTLIIATGPA